MIVITQRGSGVSLAIDPSMFILHKPRLVNIDLPGKKAFRHTTFMSIFDQSLCIETSQSYELISSIILKNYPDFCEFTHGETGTKFVIFPRHFLLVEQGYDTGLMPSVGPTDNTIRTGVTSLISVMNPIIWVSLKGSFAENLAKTPGVKWCQK